MNLVFMTVICNGVDIAGVILCIGTVSLDFRVRLVLIQIGHDTQAWVSCSLRMNEGSQNVIIALSFLDESHLTLTLTRLFQGKIKSFVCLRYGIF